MWSAVVNGTSDACTNEPSGDDLCIRHVDGYELKVRIDLKSWAVNGGRDLMGSSDCLVDMSSVVVVIFPALSVTSFDSARLRTRCCVCATPFRHLRGH